MSKKTQPTDRQAEALTALLPAAARLIQSGGGIAGGCAGAVYVEARTVGALIDRQWIEVDEVTYGKERRVTRMFDYRKPEVIKPVARVTYKLTHLGRAAITVLRMRQGLATPAGQ